MGMIMEKFNCRCKNFSIADIFKRRDQAILDQRCTWCGKDVFEFRDALSRKEYGISGLCQECQDKTFI